MNHQVGDVPELAKMLTVNIHEAITGELAKFIDSQVESGRYGSASAVVHAGLRLLQEHEAKVKALEAALIEGENSGDPRPFDFDEFIARKRAEYEARHGADVAGK
jgi:antitoxin ParD1/3/4